MAKKKVTAPKKETPKKAEVKTPKKPEIKKFGLGTINPKTDLQVGNTVTIQNERYLVKEGNKLENKVTGKIESY